MNRGQYIDKAKQTVCQDRVNVHGKPENTFALIAEYWSVYLSEEAGMQILIDAADVAVMMTLFKISRMQVNPVHSDNVIDGIGYLAVAGELIDGVAGSDELLNEK